MDIITLTDREKKVVKEAYPLLRNQDYQAAFRLIFSELPYDGPINVLNFLKQVCNINLISHINRIEDFSFSISSITSIELPDGITEIGSWAFEGCKQLTSVTLPKTMKKIESAPFEDCDALTSINYKGTKHQWSKIHTSGSVCSASSIQKICCSDGDIQVDEQ